MNDLSGFLKIFLMLPSNEAASYLLVLNRDEQLNFLCEVKKNSKDYLPKAVKELDLPSLYVFEHPEKKLSKVLMSLAEVAGDLYVDELLKDWLRCDPLIWQELRPSMFFFEEVVYLTDLSVQAVLREMKLTPLLLIGSSPAVREKLLTNVSKRVAQDIKDEFSRYEEQEQADIEVQRAKSCFCNVVMRLINSGAIENAEFPLPEITIKVCERYIKNIAEYLLKIDNKRRCEFLQKHANEMILKMLFDSKYGEEIKALLLPIASDSLREMMQNLFKAAPQRLTLEKVELIAALQQLA